MYLAYSMVRKVIQFVLFILVPMCVWGQKTFQPKQSEKTNGVVYDRELAAEIRLYTNGPISAGINIGKIKTYYKTNYYHFGLGMLKDPRERNKNKNVSIGFVSSKSFSLGKQNEVLVLRGGIGSKRYLSEKAKRKGVAIGYDYQIGPSIALLKPYYLSIYYADENLPQGFEIREEKYSEDNRDQFLDKNGNTVVGGTNFFKGISETSIIPGIQGKLGLIFSLGAFDKKVKTVETGVMFDLFIKKIPIMVETASISNQPYFINFYISFQFGNRKSL